jgi:Leucine-rich repeat (LRR) protein
MKTLILSMLVLTLVSISNAQNVIIPDAHFKNALISAGVDKNNDGEISYAECEGITYLDVQSKNISDMTGIEAFVNLNTLYCFENQLTSLDVSGCTALTDLYCYWNHLISLDVSKNTALEELRCSDNQLTSLDVSNNTALGMLSCSDNQLTSLDVSNNTALGMLSCSDNPLTSLDVSNNTALTDLYCAGNQLTSLDVSGCKALRSLYCSSNQLVNLNISKNINLPSNVGESRGFLDLSNMPTLYEVCVWGMPFPPGDYLIDTTGSPNMYFTIDCAETALKPYEVNGTIDIYPNPSDDIINIDIENINNAIIEIYNVSGILIFSKTLDSESEKIDISGFSGGVYLVKVKQDSTVIIEKVVVR